MIKFSFVPVVYIFRTSAALLGWGENFQNLLEAYSASDNSNSDADEKKEQEEQISALFSHCLVRFGCWASCCGCFLLLPSSQEPGLKPRGPKPLYQGRVMRGQPKARWQAAFSNMLSGAANIYYLFGSLPPDLRDESDVLQREGTCHGVCPGRGTRPSVPWSGPVQPYRFSLQQRKTLGLRAFHSSHRCLLWRYSTKSLWCMSSITQPLFQQGERPFQCFALQFRTPGVKSLPQTCSTSHLK